MTDQIAHREEFPTLASGIHLLSHSLGPVPRAARESMIAYYDAWEHHTSEDAWATSWWTLSRRVGDRIARILGGEAWFSSDPAKRFDRAGHSRFVFRFQKRRAKQSRDDRARLPFDGILLGRRNARSAREIEVVPSADGVSVPLEQILDAIDSETCSRRALAHVVLQFLSRRCARDRRTRACKRRARAVGRLPVGRCGATKCC